MFEKRYFLQALEVFCSCFVNPFFLILPFCFVGLSCFGCFWTSCCCFSEIAGVHPMPRIHVVPPNQCLWQWCRSARMSLIRCTLQTVQSFRAKLHPWPASVGNVLSWEFSNFLFFLNYLDSLDNLQPCCRSKGRDHDVGRNHWNCLKINVNQRCGYETTYLQNFLCVDNAQPCFTFQQCIRSFVFQFGWRLPKQMSCGLHALLLIKWPCRSHYRFVSTPLHDWESVCRFTCQENHQRCECTKHFQKHVVCMQHVWPEEQTHSVHNSFVIVNNPGKWPRTLESLNGSQWSRRMLATQWQRCVTNPCKANNLLVVGFYVDKFTLKERLCFPLATPRPILDHHMLGSYQRVEPTTWSMGAVTLYALPEITNAPKAWCESCDCQWMVQRPTTRQENDHKNYKTWGTRDCRTN